MSNKNYDCSQITQNRKATCSNNNYYYTTTVNGLTNPLNQNIETNNFTISGNTTNPSFCLKPGQNFQVALCDPEIILDIDSSGNIDMTGATTVTAPTVTSADSSTNVATTAFVQTALGTSVTTIQPVALTSDATNVTCPSGKGFVVKNDSGESLAIRGNTISARIDSGGLGGGIAIEAVGEGGITLQAGTDGNVDIYGGGAGGVNVAGDFINLTSDGNINLSAVDPIVVTATNINTNSIITANSFVKNGGTMDYVLLANGSVAPYYSGVSSNFYPYLCGQNTSIPPPSKYISFNAVDQKDASEVYISHITRDDVDIDPFLALITEGNFLYLQDRNNSINYIQYTVSGKTTIPNDYVTVFTLSNPTYGGTGGTTFGVDHPIIMSVFTNQPLINSRLIELETKTQNQSAIMNTTTFEGNVDASRFVTSDTSGNSITINDAIIFQSQSPAIVSRNTITANSFGLNLNPDTSSTVTINNQYTGYSTPSILQFTNNSSQGTMTIIDNFDNSIVSDASNNLTVQSGVNLNLNSLSADINLNPNANLNITSQSTTDDLSIILNNGGHATLINNMTGPLTIQNHDDFNIDNGTGTMTITTASIDASGATINAGSFVKIGGSSTQFLKADGSADGTTVSTLQSKTQNQTASSGVTTFTGRLVQNPVALGLNAGATTQDATSVAIGQNAGNSGQLANAVAIGIGAGLSVQGANSVAIGNTAGNTSQLASAIAIGENAGKFNQGSTAIAIGQNAGTGVLGTGQATSAIAIGTSAGSTGQKANAIAIGSNAGFKNQTADSIAIGNNACSSATVIQGTGSVAIGTNASQNGQGLYCISIGQNAGSFTAQQNYAIAIGNATGVGNQGTRSVALGYGAGNGSLGNESIAIGSYAFYSQSGANSICINATGLPIGGPTSGASNAFYVAPIRNSTNSQTQSGVLQYDISSKEIFYNTTLPTAVLNFGFVSTSLINLSPLNYYFGNMYDSSALNTTGTPRTQAYCAYNGFVRTVNVALYGGLVGIPTTNFTIGFRLNGSATTLPVGASTIGNGVLNSLNVTYTVASPFSVASGNLIECVISTTVAITTLRANVTMVITS